MLSKFYLPTDTQKSCFKRILKFTLKQLLHAAVQSLFMRERIIWAC